jgi:hypothetical protein
VNTRSVSQLLGAAAWLAMAISGTAVAGPFEDGYEAQFVYLLLHNEKIRDVIDTIGKKGVLLLGRFTEGRMVVLERLRQKLRGLGFVPMVFNFDKPETKDFTETVRLLANLSHFVIVDITNPRSAPLELQATVPDYMVPFVPTLQEGEEPFSMFVDLQNKYDWVLSNRYAAAAVLIIPACHNSAWPMFHVREDCDFAHYHVSRGGLRIPADATSKWGR